jgi:hypothetical protein
MHRDHSVLLKQAADKYLAYNKKHFSDDREMMECIYKDYEDLISIAKSMGLNESKSAISKAMWSLDTAVRDVIPDKVYSYYYE